jgi:hypothetical protein
MYKQWCINDDVKKIIWGMVMRRGTRLRPHDVCFEGWMCWLVRFAVEVAARGALETVNEEKETDLCCPLFLLIRARSTMCECPSKQELGGQWWFESLKTGPQTQFYTLSTPTSGATTAFADFQQHRRKFIIFSQHITM